MRKLYRALLPLAFIPGLLACVQQPHKPQAMEITASHSVFIEGGVLRVLSGETQDLLYIYVRPAVLDRWVVAGGGGGNEPSPWRHLATLFWAPGDASGWYPPDAPKKEFGFLFDSRSMLLTIERGTYAVKPGEFIVVALDENWQPGFVKSGLEALRIFDMPEENRQHLLREARKYYSGAYR